MTNLQDIIDHIHLRLNKDQSGMTITPEKWTKIFQVVNLEYLKLKLGLPEEYQAMGPYPRQAYQITKRLQDDTRFLVTPIPLSPVQGLAQLPPDYVYLSSLVYNYTYNRNKQTVTEPVNVELLDDMDFTARVSSRLMAPTFRAPIARFIGNDIEFAPLKMDRVKLVYVRMPDAPVYAYTVDGNDNYVYNPSASVQFEWPDICLPDLANMALSYISDNFRDMFIKQSAENRKNAGK
jgi:hypothetical protein